jgi:phosphatidylglycerophosphate synthase
MAWVNGPEQFPACPYFGDPLFPGSCIPILHPNCMNTPDDSARRPLKSRTTSWARKLSGLLVARRISPNAISVAGIAFAGIGAAALVLMANGLLPRWSGLLIGAAGVQLRLLCNMMDGLVAVEGGLKSKAGDLFNEAPDRIEDVVLLVAAGTACGQPQLGWCCATLAVATAYFRAFGASLGFGQNFCGPCAKPHRMAILTGGLLASLPPWDVPFLLVALWAIAALTTVTMVRRIYYIYTRLP